MSSKLEQAVNNMLGHTDLIASKDFIDLMGALYVQMDVVKCGIPFSKDDVLEAQDAIGEFVPSDWKGEG